MYWNIQMPMVLPPKVGLPRVREIEKDGKVKIIADLSSKK
jgi:hypothetical protein